MPSDKSLFLQEIDRLSLADTGKTAEQGRLDLIRGKQNIQAISEYQDRLYGTPKPTSGIDLNITDDQITDNISKIISINEGANNISQPIVFGGGSAGMGGLGLARSVSGENVLKLSIDELLKNSDEDSAKIVSTVLKNKLDDGNLEALDELKSYLQNIYNKADNSSRLEISKYYGQVEKYYTDKAKSNYAKQNLDNYMQTTPLDQRLKELDSFNANSDSTPIPIKPSNVSSKDVLNQYADYLQFKEGDIFYNPEYLNKFKSETGLSPLTTSKGADLAYDYNVNTLRNVYNKQKEILTEYQSAKDAIEKTEQAGIKVSDEAKAVLNNYEKEAEYLEKLASKLTPQADYYKFLHTYYPVQYEKRKAEDKQEIYKNTSQGVLGKIGESTYRGLQRTAANTVNTISGIANLVGADDLAYYGALKADNILPPPLYRARDINKDGILQESEYLKDESGQKISFDQVHYKTANGESHWNGWSAFEQVLPIAADVATTIALTRGTGAIGRGLNKSWSTWANIGESVGLSKAGQKTFLTQVAPRISTFGGTLATTFPRMYAEELKNYKDSGTAFKVATMRSAVEALTETIVPETEFFKGRTSYGALDKVFQRLGKFDPTNLAEMTLKRDILLGLTPKNALKPLKAALLTAPSSARKILSGAAQEALEEEGSLLGNYFVDRYASKQNFEIEQANELTMDNFLETLVSGFIPSLFISGSQVVQTNNKHRRDQARWDIANNPNLYLNRIEQQVSSGKITKQEGLRRTAAVKNLETRLDSMVDLRNIKNLSTLLDDKDEQFRYFNSQMLMEEMLDIDATQFTDEQKTNYQNLLDEASKVSLSAKDMAYKYQSLSEEEKKNIIKGTFETQKKGATDPNTPIISLLGASASVDAILSEIDPKDPRAEYIASLYEDYSSTVNSTLVERIDGFQETLENTPEEVTLAELLFAKKFLQPAFEKLGFSPQSQENLNTLIDIELETRSTLSEEDFYSQLEKDLKNPEIKMDQVLNLAVAELSQEELDNGELNADAHDHLPDYAKMMLASALEFHTQEKENNPEQQTSLQKAKDGSYNNHFSQATRGLSEEESLSKIKDMNARVLGTEKARTTLVETEEGIKTEAEVKEEETKKEEKELTEDEKIAKAKEKKKEKENTSNFKTKEQKEKEKEADPKKSPSAYPRTLNKGVTLELNLARSVYDIATEEDASNIQDPEEKKAFVAKKNKERKDRILTYILGEYNTLTDIESALLGFYPEDSAFDTIMSFFNSVEKGTPDYSLAKFASPQLLDVLKEKIDSLLEIKPTSQEVVQEEGDTIPDTTTQTEEEKEDSNQLELASRDNPVETPAPKTLAQVHDLVAPFDSKTVNLINYIEDQVKKGLSIDLFIASQNTPGLLKSVLEPTRYARIEQLAQKKSLSEQERTELKSLFTVNQVLIIPEKTVNYFADTPSEILNTNAVLSVITDKDGSVIYFDKFGNPTTSDQGFPYIATVKNNPELRQQIKNAGILLSPINGLRMTGGKEFGQVYKEGQEIEFNTTQFDQVIGRANGTSFTLYKGQFYIKDTNGYYTGFDTPKYEGQDIFNLIQAYNNQALGEEFPTDTVEFLNLLSKSLNLKPITDTLYKHPHFKIYFAKTKEGNRIVIKTENEAGKAVNANIKVVETLMKGITLRKNASRDLLEGTTKFKAIVFEKGKATVKEYNNYKEYFISKDFGATVPNSINNTITFGDSEISLPAIKTGETTATASIQENNPFDEQPKEVAEQPVTTDIRADIERRREKELEEFKKADNYLSVGAQGRENRNIEINAKYDAELASLGQPTTTDARAEELNWEKRINDSKNKEELLRTIEDISGRTSSDMSMGFRAVIVVPSQLSDAKRIAIQDLKDIEKFFLKGINDKYDAEIDALEQPVVEKKPIDRKAKLRRFLDNTQASKVSDADISPDELTRRRDLGNKITKKQNEEAKAWVAAHPIFKDTPFIFDQTISHPEAYALWSKSGIRLFEGANYAEAYHESWHEFSQLYLTAEQKDKLYAEAKKIWGNLSFVELEEKLAESFREYALTQGTTLPKEISDYKETKSIFEKIWDFLTNFVSNKKTIDKYFGQLYKGNISQYTRKESNAYYKQLYSSKLALKDFEGNYVPQDFKTRAAILADMDSLFVNIANSILSKQGASVINILQNPKLVDKIYKNIEQFITNEYVTLKEEYQQEENPDTELENLAVYFGEMYINLPTLFNFHKQNSDLFENKVKSKLSEEKIDELESNAETQGIGSFEASINEFSQKELASNLVINSIRTLPRYSNAAEVIHPYLGSNLLGDFEENWNILQRTLSGSSTYEEMFDKIKKLTNRYPQFKQLLSYLKDSKLDISRSSDLSFKNQFFNIFSMPYIDGATVKITRNEEGEIAENQVLRAISLDVVSYRSELDSNFNFNQGPFKTLTNEGSYALNTAEFFEQFPNVPPVPGDRSMYDDYFTQVYLQLSALGIEYSNLGFEELKTKSPNEVDTKLKQIRLKLKSLGQRVQPIYNPLGDLSKSHELELNGKKIEVQSENTSVAFFLQNEIDANPEYSNDMRYNAVEKQVWSVNQHTYMTKVLDVLNNADLYPTLDDVYKELPHLNKENNANAVGSWTLRYLFDINGKRRSEDGKPKTLNLINVFGVSEDSNGQKLIDVNQDLKHYTDIIGLVKGGIEEFNRLSGKNTTRGFALPFSARKELGLYRETKFVTSEGNVQIPSELFVTHILPLIKGEVDVYHNPSSSFKFKEADVTDGGIPQLSYFSGILSDGVRSKLVNDLKDLEGKSLEEAVRKLPYAADIYTEMLNHLKANVEESKNKLRNYPVTDADLYKYHFASFVLRVEQFKLFFNHPYYYKSEKDIEKRISAWNAFGSYPVIDEQNIRSLNLMANKPFAQEDAFLDYARQNDIEVILRNRDAGKINYLVFNDNTVVSETAKNNPNYAEVEEAYTSNKDSAAQDAAAVATVDFYRRAFALSTGITPEMEQEFDRQNKIWSTYLKSLNTEGLEKAQIEKELDDLLSQAPAYKFTIKKFQYAGNNTVLTGESVPVFHKYSIKPLLPSEAVQNKRTADILFKLMSSGADYGVFKSGTKVSETTSPVDLFDNKGEIDTTAKGPGTVDMKYFKEQVLVENKETFKSVFSTQLRKLIYKDAVGEKELQAYELYKKYMDELVQLDKGLFMEKIDNREKLVEFIVNELANKNAAEATKDLIKLKENGELAYVLDSLVDRTVMESAIVASVKNKIIRQKVNGVQRVQFPVSLVSSRKLKYYDLKDGKVIKAEAMISFSKNYYPLFNLDYNGEKIGQLDSKGNPVNKRQGLIRLNEALQDADFVKANERALSIFAIRIPGQGYNSMENFIIVEFLPEEAGEIILVPDEMVIKSGSDYDIDKLFTYEPYLSKSGSAERNNLTPKEVIARNKQIKEQLTTYRLLLGEALADKRTIVDEIEKLFENKEFTKASDVYEELQKLKNFTVDSQEELIDTNQIDPIEALKRKFEKGESYEEIVGSKLTKEEKRQREERKTKIKELTNLLRSYSKLGLGVKLTELNNSIGSLFQTISTLEDEQKGLRNKLSNNILFNISDRLTQEEIFSELITPNSISLISKEAKDIEPPDTEKASYTNIVNPIYQLYVFYLNAYKKALGTDAKNNVLHSILQKADVQLVNPTYKQQYFLPANMKGEDITFTGITDTNGRRISLIQGQMISAHVDIEKNDAIARIGLDNVITPVVNYMLMAGTPFEDIVKVINTSYNDYNPILEFAKSRDLTAIVNALKDRITDPSVTLLLDDLFKNGVVNKNKVLAKLSIIGKSNSKETLIQYLNEKSDLGNAYRFLFIVGMKEHADKMFVLSANTDYDTMSPQNFESFRKGQNNLSKLIKENIFNKEGIEKVINQSITSEFEVQQDILDKLTPLFPISANPSITDFIIEAHSGLRGKFKPDYDKFSRIFKNDLLYSLYANNTSYVSNYSSFLRKDSTQNIKTLYDSIKVRLEERGIKSENKIFDLARFNSSEKVDYIRTGLRQTSYDYSVDFYREEFERGINYFHPELSPGTNEADGLLIDDIQDWFEAFAVAGIMGTNLNKKFDSYLPLIPENFYTNSMNDILKDFVGLSEEQQKEYLTSFYKNFRFNHPELFGVRPNVLQKNLPFYKDYINEAPEVAEITEEQSEADVIPTETQKSTESNQLNLFEDQPRLTPQEIAERERLERESVIDFQQESIANEELYYEYTLDKQSFTDLDLPAEAKVLQEMRPTRDSFVNFSDKANLQGSEGKSLILNYIAKKGDGFTLDIIAQRASDIDNREITPQDIIDFMLRYPGGIGTINSKSENTYYGFNNPDVNSKYDSIRDLIKKRKNQRRQSSTTSSVTNVEDDIFGSLGDLNDIDFNVQNNQAVQDSLNAIRDRNKKNKDGC
jgi:hypothetical protein